MPTEDVSFLNLTFVIVVLTVFGWFTSVVYRVIRLAALLWHVSDAPEKLVLCPRRFVTAGKHTLSQLLDLSERKALLPREMEVLKVNTLVHQGFADAHFSRSGGGDGDNADVDADDFGLSATILKHKRNLMKKSGVVASTVSLRLEFPRDKALGHLSKLRFRVMWCRCAAEIEHEAVHFIVDSPKFVVGDESSAKASSGGSGGASTVKKSSSGSSSIKPKHRSEDGVDKQQQQQQQQVSDKHRRIQSEVSLETVLSERGESSLGVDDLVFQDFADFPIDLENPVFDNSPVAAAGAGTVPTADGVSKKNASASSFGSDNNNPKKAHRRTASHTSTYSAASSAASSTIGRGYYVPVTSTFQADGTCELVFAAPDDELIERIYDEQMSQQENPPTPKKKNKSGGGGGDADDDDEDEDPSLTHTYMLAVVGAFNDDGGVSRVIPPASVRSQFAELFPELAQSETAAAPPDASSSSIRAGMVWTSKTILSVSRAEETPPSPAAGAAGKNKPVTEEDGRFLPPPFSHIRFDMEPSLFVHRGMAYDLRSIVTSSSDSEAANVAAVDKVKPPRCTLCHEAAADVVLLKCGCFAICRKCSMKQCVEFCPQCKAKVTAEIMLDASFPDAVNLHKC